MNADPRPSAAPKLAGKIQIERLSVYKEWSAALDDDDLPVSAGNACRLIEAIEILHAQNEDLAAERDKLRGLLGEAADWIGQGPIYKTDDADIADLQRRVSAALAADGAEDGT